MSKNKNETTAPAESKTYAACIATVGTAPAGTMRLADDQRVMAARMSLAVFMAADRMEPARKGSRVDSDAIVWKDGKDGKTATVTDESVYAAYGFPISSGRKLLSLGRIALGQAILRDDTDALARVLVILSRNGKTFLPDGKTIAKVPNAKTVETIALGPDFATVDALIDALETATAAQAPAKTRKTATPEPATPGVGDGGLTPETAGEDVAVMGDRMVAGVIDALDAGDLTPEQIARLVDALVANGHVTAAA